MNTVDQSTSLEEFLSWKTESLKSFLTKRGLGSVGNKNELAALCFSANKLNLPIIPSKEEVIQENSKCYRDILEKTGIEDPLKIYEGWQDEKAGLASWPPTFLSDITSFFLNNGDVPNVDKILKDYKVGKAYEYFVSGWLKEVFFHQISKTSPVCLLRGKCCPSQRLKDDMHDVWVCLDKSDGSVKAAYCSCTAGLGQTCNHVAALLFRVEAANRYGVASCTSTPCTWSVPKDLKKLEPSPLASMNMKKSNRSKTVKSRPLVSAEKKTYDPLKESTDSEDALSSLSIALRGLLPNACIFTGLPSNIEKRPDDDLQKKNSQDNSALIETFSMVEIAERFLPKTSCYDFINFLPSITNTDIEILHKATIGQNKNINWHKLHKGRITASKFYQVYTKVNTILKNPENETNISSLLCYIMGYTTINPNIKSIKYGRETEPVAVDVYMSSYKKNHKDVIFSECGLFLDCNDIYLGASPDLLVKCSCCGDGLLEVKCPIIPPCEKCKGFCVCNLPSYIIFSNNVFNLKRNDAYYVQVQGQLAITGRSWCDFFVYTCNGFLETRVTLDKETYYKNLLPNLQYFFKNFIAPELLTKKLEKSRTVHEPMEVDNYVQASVTYFCPVCNNVIKEVENIVCFNERSICCDKCNLWYHFKCVKVKQSDINKIVNWICQTCQINSR